MKKEKKNPRSKPATQADVDRAFWLGQDRGLNLAMVIFMYTLCDKHGVTAHQVEALWNEFNYVADSITKDYMTIEDAAKVLLDVHDVDLHLLGDVKVRGRK